VLRFSVSTATSEATSYTSFVRSLSAKPRFCGGQWERRNFEAVQAGEILSPT
jgi:hypothetical protein